MHPVAKGALVAFQVIKTIDETSGGKLKKEGIKIAKDILKHRKKLK